MRGSSFIAALSAALNRQGVVAAGAAAGALLLDDEAADEDESPPDELLLEEDSADVLVPFDESAAEASVLPASAAAGSASLFVEPLLFL